MSAAAARGAAWRRLGRARQAAARSAGLAIAVLSTSCGPPAATSPDTLSGDRTPATGAAAGIERLAAVEAETAPRPPAELPTPPGIDPGVLARRDPGDLRAVMGLAEAIADLAAGSTAAEKPAGTGPVAGAPADRLQAMRHYAKGREAAINQHHLVAVVELQKALELDPDAPDVHRALARSYLAMGNMSRGVSHYETMLEHESEDPEALFVVGLAAANRLDHARALTLLGRPEIGGRPFTHDPAAEVIAASVLADSFRHLGYDRASVEAAQTVLEMSPQLARPTVYGPRYGTVYRRRGELWRAVGDAACRLGAYEEALRAYAGSARLPAADPGALYPRVLYASLALGRVFGAQRELLGVLTSRPTAITDREIGLCEYVAANAPPTDLLAEAVRDLFAEHPDDAGVARAASTLLPRPEALALLRDFILRRDTDLEVVSQFLDWLARDDPSAAVAFTLALCQGHPDLSRAYTERLAGSFSSPGQGVALVAAEPESPARAAVECALLQWLGATGRAWSVCAEARRDWPDEETLALIQLELAAELEEPALVDDAVAVARSIGSVRAWRTITQAELAISRIASAVGAARRAVELGPDDAGAITDLARVLAAGAIAEDDESVRRAAAQEAVLQVERAIELSPDSDASFDVLLALFGPGGPLEDGAAYRAAGRRLFEANPDSPLYARIIAREAITQGRMDQALERLLGVYENDPSDRRSLGMAVTAWTRMGKMETARRWLEEQRAARPGDPILLEQWVRIRLLSDEGDDTVDELRSMLASDPGNAAVHRLLETAYRATNRPADATRLGRERLRSRPEGIRRALMLAALEAESTEPEAAREHLSWFVARADDATYDMLVQSVFVARSIEDVDTGGALMLGLVDATIDRYPDAPLQVYGLALRAIAIEGDRVGRFRELAGRAARSARGATDGTLQSALVWRGLAQELVDAGHPAAASEALRARLGAETPLEAVSRSVLVMAAVVADAAAGGRAEETIELLTRFQEGGGLTELAEETERPPLSELLYEISQVYTTVGDEVGAARLLEETIRLDAGHTMAMNNLGYMRVDAGRDDAATIRWVEDAYTADPEDGNILDTVGWLRYKQGQFEDDADQPGARSLIEASAALEEEPGPEVLDHLGDTWWRLGQPDRALENWRQVVRLLDDPELERRWIEVYRELQERNWMLLVADPQALYDRNMGAVLDRAAAKIAAVEAGDTPPVAQTFAETTDDTRREAE